MASGSTAVAAAVPRTPRPRWSDRVVLFRAGRRRLGHGHPFVGCVLTSFHQFSPVCGLRLKLMLCRRNMTSTGVLLLN
jgi:hypothetical protein